MLPVKYHKIHVLGQVVGVLSVVLYSRTIIPLNEEVHDLMDSRVTGFRNNLLRYLLYFELDERKKSRLVNITHSVSFFFT